MSFYMFFYAIVYHRLRVLVSENVALFLKT